MRTHSLLVLASLGSAFGACAQDALWYKSDEAGGLKAVNYASASSLAPAEGTIFTTDTTAFAPGRNGPTSLRGGPGSTTAYTYVDSGYNPTFTGSFTVAWFMKSRLGGSSTGHYFFTQGTGLFRIFTGTSLVSGSGLWCRAWGGTPADLTTTYDVITNSMTKWLHVALVVDATAMLATWYIDGVVQSTVPLTAGASIVTGTNPFRVNAYSTPASYPGWYDVDDFRFSQRAALAVEILAWSKANLAADAPYGTGCGGASLAGSGGPTLGNPLYQMRITGSAGSLYSLGLGASRSALGAVPLPLDLGLLFPKLNGCNWECSADVTIAGSLSGTSSLVILSIPNTPALDGVALWNQALLVSGGVVNQSTNGLAVGIGK